MKAILAGLLVAIALLGLAGCGDEAEDTQRETPLASPTARGTAMARPETPAASPTVPGTAVAPQTPAPSPAPTQTSTPGQEAVARSDEPRATPPAAAEADVAGLVAGNSTFAFDLYQALRGEPGNLFYSPYSISQALAMTYAGARGETQRQMADTLSFALAGDRLHPAFNALDLPLARRGEGPRPGASESYRLNIANALWGQQGYAFLPEFLDVLAQNYGAGLRLLDFVAAPEESRVTINDWVSDQTEGKIQDLLPQGAVDDLTRLVLTNAIYFNASWAFRFSPEDTEDGTFHLLDGGEVTVPMMHQGLKFPYAEGEGYQAIKLPYGRGELSMVILLPAAGQFEAFESSLDADRVDSIIDRLEEWSVTLSMPRFKFESAFDLGATLAAMGMPDAFGAADFSGMTGNRELAISFVVHKAFVSVDEEGTEAAAATGVGMTASAPQKHAEFTVDRPFIFLIRDNETGAILFLGRVVNPAA